MLKLKDKAYTLDELKQQVEEFKSYLSMVCKKNNCYICIEIDNVIGEDRNPKTSKVTSRINIF